MAVGKFYYAITSQSILVNRCIVNEKNNKVAEKNGNETKKIMWRWVQKFPHRLWNGTECNRQANNTRKRCEELIKPMIER